MQKKRMSIRQDITSTGESIATFTRFSKIAPLTLLRMEQDDPGIRPQTWARAERKFQEFLRFIQSRQESRAVS